MRNLFEIHVTERALWLLALFQSSCWICTAGRSDGETWTAASQRADTLYIIYCPENFFLFSATLKTVCTAPCREVHVYLCSRSSVISSHFFANITPAGSFQWCIESSFEGHKTCNSIWSVHGSFLQLVSVALLQHCSVDLCRAIDCALLLDIWVVDFGDIVLIVSCSLVGRSALYSCLKRSRCGSLRVKHSAWLSHAAEPFFFVT